MEESTREISVVENVSRAFARAFVIAGGVFWIFAAFTGPYLYHDVSFTESAKTAMWPFLATVVILATGWVYERLAAVLLFCGSAAVIVWGVLYAWEVGVWILVTLVLIGPMVIAGILLLVAAYRAD